MATMYITEYNRICADADGHVIQAGFDDGNTTHQVITFDAETKSAAFQDDTKFILVTLSAAGFVKFGDSPTAVTATDQYLGTTPIFIGVKGGQKISAIS